MKKKTCWNLAIIQADEGGDSQCDRDPVDRQIRFQNCVGWKYNSERAASGENKKNLLRPTIPNNTHKKRTGHLEFDNHKKESEFKSLQRIE